MAHVMSLARFTQHYSEDYRERVLDLIAWLLRYGPKSINELEARSTSDLNELADHIGRLMDKEQANFDQNLRTGDS